MKQQTIRPGWPPFATWQRRRRQRTQMRDALRGFVTAQTLLIESTRDLCQALSQFQAASVVPSDAADALAYAYEAYHQAGTAR